MTEDPKQESSTERLRDMIRAAFPDQEFFGAIAPVDRDPAEDLDEEQALYGTLYGKKWSEIPASFLKHYAYSIVLLTAESFAMFLPAWLLCALDDPEVREPMLYTFSPDKDTAFMDRKLQWLNGAQKEAIRAFLAHSLDAEPSAFLKDHARRALEHLGSI